MSTTIPDIPLSQKLPPRTVESPTVDDISGADEKDTVGTASADVTSFPPDNSMGGNASNTTPSTTRAGSDTSISSEEDVASAAVIDATATAMLQMQKKERSVSNLSENDTVEVGSEAPVVSELSDEKSSVECLLSASATMEATYAAVDSGQSGLGNLVSECTGPVVDATDRKERGDEKEHSKENAKVPASSPPNPRPLPSSRKKHTVKMTLDPRKMKQTPAPKVKGPSTPLGPVVESGQEATGRWTREEHDAFLSALQKYGKEWKKVASKVKTRTVVQTRTHAQKYFQKLHKLVVSGKDDTGHIDMMSIMSSKDDMEEATVSGRKKARSTRNVSSCLKDPDENTRVVNVSLTVTDKPLQEKSGNAVQEKHQEAVVTAAELMTHMSTAVVHTKTKLTCTEETRSASSSSPVLSTSLSNPQTPSPNTIPPTSHRQPSLHPPQHPPQSQSIPPLRKPLFIKIIAPTPDQTRRNRHPEPSPAACGKRKLAEIAAAQMLAGVASARSINNINNHNNNKTSSVSGNRLQIQLPETLDAMNIRSNSKRRKIPGSPSTPWDCQLEALVSNFKKQNKNFTAADVNSLDSTKLKSIPDQTDQDKYGPDHPLSTNPARPPIHNAVCSADSNLITLLLSSEHRSSHPLTASDLSTPDSTGYHPLHSAASLPKNPATIVRLLLKAGAEVNCRDRRGNTPLHWAVRHGNATVAQLLMFQNCRLATPNDEKETALHWAMRAGLRGRACVRVLLEGGARASLLNGDHRRPLDVAAVGFDCDFQNSVCLEDQRETRVNLLRYSSQSRTLVLHHPECLDHIPKSEADWEVPDRVKAILDKILPRELGFGDNDGDNARLDPSRFLSHEITVSTEFDRASLELLSRVHSTEFLAFVNDLSKELERRKKEEDGSDSGIGGATASIVPFTPMVQKTFTQIDRSTLKDHSDTSFSAGSLRAARRAAGAVQHAVDCVLMGRNRNAFCVVRPPGHHAGINGLLQNSESCGFCIFNNVAAGALHALSDRHRPRCQRCAIVDIDVHHGNGTEEIVQKCHDPARLLFFSIHLFDHDAPAPPKGPKDRAREELPWKFYPGTGDVDDVANNIINVPIAPLWKEKQVMSAANNPVSPRNRHNTRSKQKQAKIKPKPHTNTKAEDESDASTSTAASPKMQNGSVPQSPKTPNHFLMGVGRKAYRQAIEHRLLPALRAFNPDLILMSAGFDAAKGDVGNAKHMAGGKEKVGLDLEPEDYAWTTRMILKVADICCQGRVVSVLEGGYGKTPTRASDVSLDKSNFSECAAQHIRALVDPYDVEKRI